MFLQIVVYCQVANMDEIFAHFYFQQIVLEPKIYIYKLRIKTVKMNRINLTRSRGQVKRVTTVQDILT